MFDVKQLIHDKLPTRLKSSWVEWLLVFFLSRLLKEKEINDLLREEAHSKGYDFIDAVLDYFHFSYQVSDRDKQMIPPTGRCVLIANHPLGALDALALLHLVLNVRPDVAIVANNLLSQIDALNEYLLPVDNIAGESSTKRMVAISRALEAEKLVIIFPAGEVSRTHWLTIRDRVWGRGFYLFSRRTNADILPVFVGGKNSFWFYACAKINNTLAMLLLPRQMWRQRDKVITLKIGAPLPLQIVRQLPVDDGQKVKMLRRHVYQLGKKRKGLFSVPEPVAHPERRHDIRAAINTSKVLGRDAQDQRILLFKSEGNSALLREIGRLRELTFRQVGEGSGKRRDIDKYDTYYEHLVIWNDDDLDIMGAYRILPIYQLLVCKPCNHLSALYTSSLFDFSGDLSWLSEGLELGRSFVQPKYWGTRSLDYLWQGIGAYIACHPQVRYLFGTVSISANYPDEVTEYLVAFYRHYFSNEAFAITSKKPYQLSAPKQQYYDDLFKDKDYTTAYKIMKHRLREINLTIPTLFKHYTELCQPGGATFADFGIDEHFAHCVDGFIIIDLSLIRPNKKARYIEPFMQAQDE